MTRPCSICIHASRADADRMLATGTASAEVARLFGWHVRTVSRHAAKHLPAALQQAESERAGEEAFSVLTQAKQLNAITRHLLVKAMEQDNPKLALAAVREVRGNLELLGKLLGELDDRPQVNVVMTAQWVDMRTMILTALAPYPDAKQAVALALTEAEHVAQV